MKEELREDERRYETASVARIAGRKRRSGAKTFLPGSVWEVQGVKVVFRIQDPGSEENSPSGIGEYIVQWGSKVSVP